jgi:uncharacterized protein
MHELYALPESTLARLEDFLDGEDNEHGLDFCGTHGFLCAVTVGPTREPGEWLAALFEDQVPADLVDDLKAWQKSLHACLYHEQTLELPCDLQFSSLKDGNELTDWCVGFMEGIFSLEEAWYARDEDMVAELTLPMVAVSGLVEDPELEQMRRQPKLMMQLVRQIPSILTEIYLLFHAPRNV